MRMLNNLPIPQTKKFIVNPALPTKLSLVTGRNERCFPLGILGVADKL